MAEHEPGAAGRPGGSTEPKVAILLCTLNSGGFIRPQMESYFAQTHRNWELWASDDGSSDGTAEIIGEYAGRGRAIRFLAGPRRGCPANFMSLTRRADLDADYFAWSDSDDVWLPDKLARAVARLAALPTGTPGLYCGRTILVDRDDGFLGLSPRFARPPSFANALCQNIGGGNTMAFNRPLRGLLRQGGDDAVFSHDWWAYLLATGAGGRVIYDPEPCLRYRQHGGNLTGENRSPAARLRRARRLFRGGMREMNRLNLAALEKREPLLTLENRETLARFALARRTGNRWERLRLLRQAGIRRQSRLHTLALWLAALLGRYP